MIGIAIKPKIGLGDALQFSSVPENYFRATGQKLIDINHPWFFDKNPYLIKSSEQPQRIQEMWNFGPTQYEWPNPRQPNESQVYLSNAEIWATLFGVPVVLNRPRLYLFEDFPYAQRKKILLQVEGVSHGWLPQHVVEHVLIKYGDLVSILGPIPKKLEHMLAGVPRESTPTNWHLAEVISQARMLIGPDSGPAWVAACYPDVVVKKVRMKPSDEVLETWIPLEIRNHHSHWDDRCHLAYNITDRDIGYTMSYKRL